MAALVCLCGGGREKREKVTLPGLRSRWEMDEMAREQHRDAKRLATFFQYMLSPLLSLSCFLFWNKKSPTIQGFNQTSCQYLLVGCCSHRSLHLLIEDHTYESTEKTPPNNTLEGNTMIISVVIYLWELLTKFWTTPSDPSTLFIMNSGDKQPWLPHWLHQWLSKDG